MILERTFKKHYFHLIVKLNVILYLYMFQRVVQFCDNRMEHERACHANDVMANQFSTN